LENVWKVNVKLNKYKRIASLAKGAQFMVKKSLVILLSFVFLLSIVSTTHSQTSDFEEFVAQMMLQRNVAGVSIARIESGEIVEQFALSHPDLDSSSLTKDSVFQVGSISKPVAAWTVMTLVRDGKVELGAPISRYVSSWSLPPSNFDADQVTVSRLLSHTAGLSLHGYPGFAQEIPLPTTQNSLSGETNGAGRVELVMAPGEQFKYSGGGYTLLQLMIEEVTGVPFSQYATHAVLKPLGMESSSYEPNAKLRAKRAQPYIQLTPMDYFEFRAQAAASLHSTAHDLATFVLANMQSNPVLSADLKQKMHTGVKDIGSRQVGLGFFIDPKANTVGHNGANQGWRAELIFNPELNSGLVVLANSDNASFFIQQIRCQWDKQFSNGAMQESCQAQMIQHNSQQSIFNLMMWGLIVMSLALLIFRVISVKRGKTQIGLPSSKIRWALIVLFAILICAAVVLMHTPLGVLLIAGIKTTLSAVDFFPEGMSKVLLTVYGLLLCLLLFNFARRPV
jgi:CubicO group peptidase (beta-lactamase class C family)